MYTQELHIFLKGDRGYIAYLLGFIYVLFMACCLLRISVTRTPAFKLFVSLPALGYFESCWSQQGLSPLHHIESSGCVPPILLLRNKANNRPEIHSSTAQCFETKSWLVDNIIIRTNAIQQLLRPWSLDAPCRCTRQKMEMDHSSLCGFAWSRTLWILG